MNNNVNDNGRSSFKNKNDNDNVYLKSNKVEDIAMALVRKLDNPDAYRFYCKCAYKLPENVIWNLFESAEKGKEPQRLFTWLANREMHRRG